MEGRATKTTALTIAALCLALSFCDGTAQSMQLHARVTARIAYSFFHAGFLHALVNVYVFLACFFIFNLRLRHLILAFAIAASFPIDLIAHYTYMAPTVGLSAVCYALLGSLSHKAVKRFAFHAWVVAFIALPEIIHYIFTAIGFNVAAVNTPLHIYAYILACLIPI